MALGRGVKKRSSVAAGEFARMFDQVSKAALIDSLWCACQLGTNESAEEITTQAARNVCAALEMRADRIPRDIFAASGRRIDSDPE